MTVSEYDPILGHGNAVKLQDNGADALSVEAGHSQKPSTATPSHTRNSSMTDDSEAEMFTSLRVLNFPKDDAVPLHDKASRSDQETTFLEDIQNMTPGSVPHSAMVGVTIGIVCGLLSYVYYTTLEWALEFLWHTLPSIIIEPYVDPAWYWIWIPILGFTCAIGVGLSVQLLGEPGDLSYTVQCVHDKAYIGMDHVVPMVIASQFSILGGGSLGPEAPLVAICASFSGYISRKIFKQTKLNLIRKHTLMGMACALAAFFGVPLGGSLFALEINNRFGIEYYEHTMEAIFSGTVCICVFRAIAQLDIGAIWMIAPIAGTMELDTCTTIDILIGAVIGLLGAAVAAIFSLFHQSYVMVLFRRCDLLHNSKAVKRALAGSSVMLLIGVLIPQTLFWGEAEFQMLARGSPAAELPHVFPTTGLINFEMNSFWTAIVVGVAKMIAVSFTVAGGYRGGFIFPFFAAGAAFGRALTYLIPSLPITIATLCFAAGINVAITRTALATTLILCALAGEPNAISPVLAASMVSLFVTSYMVSYYYRNCTTVVVQPLLHLCPTMLIS
jgi:H+/Cl- antiporter ClcA